VEIGPEPVVEAPPLPPMVESHPEPTGAEAWGGGYALSGADVLEAEPQVTAGVRVVADPNDPATWRDTARNAPCPCGSGKKYKHCHGRQG
jgi:preprotein translocase subunit SecA